MPRVARQEARPEDWAETTMMALAWEEGYVHSGAGLVCRACGAVVPQHFGTSGTAGLAQPRQRHDDWHEELEGRLGGA
jgi:hypothetical protein